MYPAYLQVLGNAFLSHIQAVDGMYHIVRAFDNDEVLHVDDSIDPVRDLSKSFYLSYYPPPSDKGEGDLRCNMYRI